MEMAGRGVDGFTLRNRTIIFAGGAGIAALLLALAAVWGGQLGAGMVVLALLAAIAVGIVCWLTAEYAFTSSSAAMDIAVGRLSRAAEGDLTGRIPDGLSRRAPRMADAMERLFRQWQANMDNVHRLALFDPVTGLPNRTHFRRSCERELAMLPAGRHAVLYFIDLDRFKTINDTMGHASGDILLGMVATRLRGVANRFTTEESTRRPLVGRLAGDEFTMFFPVLDNIRDAERIARAVLFALSEEFSLSDQQVSLGASIGIAIAPEHGRSLNELMRAADAAMYHAKNNGGGHAIHFNDSLAAEIAERAQLESDLRDAMEKSEFRLVYQPQLCARSRNVVAAEALLRWQHPDGLKMPATFIHRAEETGLIVEIGDWVIARAAETIVRWQELGVRQRLAVNVSPRQIDHAGFFHRLRAALEDARAPAELLELEITESLAMRCSQEVVEAIAELRAEGASIAIDDFGTGYSNLARLRELPVDRVKLDRSLIEHVVERGECRTVAQAVINLIHGLGYEAVAEGIETEAQAEVLRLIGCDVLQGFALGRPMMEEDFLAWVHRDDVHVALHPSLATQSQIRANMSA